MYVKCCSVTKPCLTLCDPMDCSMPGFPGSNLGPLSWWCHPAVSYSYCPLLLLPSIFPNISVFSNRSALHMRWSKYWSFSICLSNDYSGLISFRIDCLISLQSKGLSRVFFNTTVQKHQFFGTQPSLWPSSHIHTWLLEKPQLWLNGPFSAS